ISGNQVIETNVTETQKSEIIYQNTSVTDDSNNNNNDNNNDKAEITLLESSQNTDNYDKENPILSIHEHSDQTTVHTHTIQENEQKLCIAENIQEPIAIHSHESQISISTNQISSPLYTQTQNVANDPPNLNQQDSMIHVTSRHQQFEYMTSS